MNRPDVVAATYPLSLKSTALSLSHLARHRPRDSIDAQSTRTRIAASSRIAHLCFRRNNRGVFGNSKPLPRSDFTELIACSMCVNESDRRMAPLASRARVSSSSRSSRAARRHRRRGRPRPRDARVRLAAAHHSVGTPTRARPATDRETARVRDARRAMTIPAPTPARDGTHSVFRRGPKASNARDALDESKLERVARSIDTSRAAWAAPRGSSETILPCAVWRARVGRAEVVRARGRHFHRFGCARGDAVWLFPEECAFLVETERLALFFSDVDDEPASVRAVYALLTRCGVSREEYLAYAYLCRLGFACRRFGAAWTADARASEETWIAASDGLGRWKKDDDGEKVDDVDDEEARRKKRRVETPPDAVRQRGATSRVWWPSTRHPGHAWIGPEIHDAVELRAPRAPAPLEYDETPVDVSLTFQVYQPNRNFSKKSPDPVSFYAYVCSAKPPDGREMRRLLDQAGGKPVRVVNCRQSTVMMFTFSDA